MSEVLIGREPESQDDRPPLRKQAAGASRLAVASRHETLVFRLAMAAAALWVLDDAFWHGEPGTAVGDHLASGLVPAALAALVALAYPRLRAVCVRSQRSRPVR